MDTYFAPAERTERRKFKNQIETISYSPVMNTLLKTMSGLLVVLNEDRQIVTLNNAFLNTIGIKNPEKVLGLRLGESLNCIHAYEEPEGCGTTPHCATCGAVIAIMISINDDRPDERICALTSEKDGVTKDICLLVRTQPIIIENVRWILVFAQDITQQQFWINLEKVFFHDISNLLSILFGNSQLLAIDMPDNPKIQQLNNTVERLNSEILLQRSLSHHKDDRYLLRRAEVSISDIRKEVDLVTHNHKSARDKRIEETWPAENMKIITDILLVSRVLGNMIINALEDTEAGDTVRLTCELEPSFIVWRIWNRCPIPTDIQKRIFQRHFSTKSDLGRGLGTYSMKLFGEKYLKGQVTFVSSPEAGTTFAFHLPRNRLLGSSFL
jgi:nitrogen-specific signal transduction histidine kinase